MENDYIRDAAMYTAVFGMFGFAWFGWAQENPPNKLRFLLAAGSVISFTAACIGGYLAMTNWGSGSALAIPGAYQSFGIVVAIEIVTALIGSLFLIKHNNSRRVAAWVAFVVGIHFIPLAVLFQDTWLYLLALIISTVSIISMKVSFKKIKQNTFVCVATGCVLLVYALRGLVLYALMT